MFSTTLLLLSPPARDRAVPRPLLRASPYILHSTAQAQPCIPFASFHVCIHSSPLCYFVICFSSLRRAEGPDLHLYSTAVYTRHEHIHIPPSVRVYYQNVPTAALFKFCFPPTLSSSPRVGGSVLVTAPNPGTGNVLWYSTFISSIESLRLRVMGCCYIPGLISGRGRLPHDV